MTATLLWIRHGESFSNLTKHFSHRTYDPPLTAKGRLQAEQTAEHLRSRPVHALYTSPLQRAVQTAETIGRALGLDLTIVEGFREVNVGVLEQEPPTLENYDLYLSTFRRWFAGHPEASFPGGEDYITLSARMSAGLEQVIDGRDGQTIAVVGHGGCISGVVHEFCPDMDPKLVWEEHSQNCSITEIVFDVMERPLRGRLVTWSDYRHLYGEAAELVPGLPGGGSQGLPRG